MKDSSTCLFQKIREEVETTTLSPTTETSTLETETSTEPSSTTPLPTTADASNTSTTEGSGSIISTEETPTLTETSSNTTGSPNLSRLEESSGNVIQLNEYLPFFNETLLTEVRVVVCRYKSADKKFQCADVIPEIGACEGVTEVQYVIFHNGSEGISSMEARIFVKDLCLLAIDEDSISLEQKFSVKYRWVNTNEDLVFEHSGRPGYVKEKPLLIGTLVKNITEEGKYAF